MLRMPKRLLTVFALAAAALVHGCDGSSSRDAAGPGSLRSGPAEAEAAILDVLQDPDAFSRAARLAALLPTLGGQTALNTAMDLVRRNRLEPHGVKLIGAKADAIEMAVAMLESKLDENDDCGLIRLLLPIIPGADGRLPTTHPCYLPDPSTDPTMMR